MSKVSWASKAESDDYLFDSLCSVISRRIPKFAIKYKNESIVQKIIGFLAFFCDGYMNKYVSTFYPNVFFPSKKFVEENKWRAFKILAHEYVHLLDRKNSKILFEILYVFPQWLFVFSILSILSIWFSWWWLIALVCLLVLAPWPSTRAHLEMRAYTMGIAINIWKHGSITDKTREWLVHRFVGWDYYKMYPKADTVKEWIAKAENLVRAIDAIKPEVTVFDTSEAFEDVYSLLTDIEFGEIEE